MVPTDRSKLQEINFSNVNYVKSTRWHVDERACDGQIRHVDDSLQWKKIDSLFPDFSFEPRDLRLTIRHGLYNL